jgi:hypothetical protein
MNGPYFKFLMPGKVVQWEEGATLFSNQHRIKKGKWKFIETFEKTASTRSVFFQTEVFYHLLDDIGVDFFPFQ